VLRTGKRAVIYVEKPNTERPTYEGREIVLGPRAGNFYLVTAGLEAGERVVTNGAFKIDSALQIQAKPSMMNPEGGGPAPGHQHGGSPGGGDPHAGHDRSAAIEIPTKQVEPLLDFYLAMQAALAADDLEAAKTQAKAMMEVTGHSGALPELLHDMLATDSLEAIRLPHFEALSNAMIAAIRMSPDTFPADLLIMYCPMANNNAGADWLQNKEPLQNPYFGAQMLECGEVKETLGAPQPDNEVHE
jgi:Cu(I)/Ag(I) efflux system membrane fusion protein